MRCFLLGLLLLSCGSVTGCASSEPPPPPTTIAPIDTAHVTAVEVRLKGDTELATETIKVTAKGDTVVLEGSVQKPDEKTRAEQLARSVKGVEKVDNKLEVVGQP